MSDINNILHNDEELNEEQLMKYIQGALSEEELHAVEKQMADNDFVNDAVEGLENFSNKQHLQQYVNDLNQQLHKQTEAKKKRKLKRRLKDNSLITISVVIIILLCTMAWYIIHLQQQQKQPRNPKPAAGQIISS